MQRVPGLWSIPRGVHTQSPYCVECPDGAGAIQVHIPYPQKALSNLIATLPTYARQRYQRLLSF